MVIGEAQLGVAARCVHDVLTNQENENPRASQHDIDDLVEILTGRPMSQRDLVAVAEAREVESDLLTQQQASVLDHIRLMNRVEVQGGAGSGKTWLAVEQARRLAKQGKRVGLLCYSRGLTAYLKRRVELLPDDQRPAYVGTFHELGVAWGAPRGLDDDSDYWENRLPLQMRHTWWTRNGLTRSSSTRRRTSPTPGGPRWLRDCATRSSVAYTRSRTRASASSPGKDAHP